MFDHSMPHPLLRTEAFIGGNWYRGERERRTAISNPATGAVLAEVVDLQQKDLEWAVQCAYQAFPSWRRMVAGQRALLLRAWYDEIMQHVEPLAEIITLEQGKPITESIAEVRYAASFIEWFAEEAKRLYGELVPPHMADKRIMVTRQPVGVVASITPWNFPAAMIARKVAPALAAGCTVIAKPAPQTPFTALALAALAEKAGLPAGVLNVVPTTDSEMAGNLLTSDLRIAKISFTGSTAVGKKLMAACSGTLKRLSLELGGNAPFLVFDDANLEDAVQGAVASKYRNAGQTCVCANRFLVHRSVSDVFASKLAAEVQNLRVGNGMMRGVDQGPLINESAVQKVEAHVQDAISKGATLVCGGKRHPLGGTYFTPTVLTGVNRTMLIAHEETFGPVAPIMTFDSDQEAIDLANDTRAGLAAYFYTESYQRFWRISEALDYGIVGHNTGLISTEIAPFGGMKESGVGREGSRHGILDYTELQYICSHIG
ncbi:Succinate-semialdehyde dehydrogenase [NADP(+)] GabD [Pirellula sp. SH-Sr6A]|uniref:NAD-dependent succinate-semialdehyde dehydrogenase n=1 Tax=Pirellula sp. SH-Sr6A TaxID=1632865 RepID=UPI00078BABF7|nr:NAD-dependent succinate-semialdehyde dehydrogenase [Pirellula sp. SH-Sr6A]AMV30499.1 Succinate-semialdehyde dehydrogenase [NADP(+)] GabD [Pirellula sp. SH-Sr6A]